MTPSSVVCFFVISVQSEGAHLVTREYALFCRGRFISQSVGEHVYYAKNDLNIGKALESAKSNALMRCCKDLGIASELWDPQVGKEGLFVRV